MKKSRSDSEDDMRAEYDFTKSIRGKHHKSMRAGYTITIHGEDGTTIVKEVKPREAHRGFDPS